MPHIFTRIADSLIRTNKLFKCYNNTLGISEQHESFYIQNMVYTHLNAFGKIVKNLNDYWVSQ